MVQVDPPSKAVDHQCMTRYIQQIKDPQTRLVLPQRLSPKNYSQRPTDKCSIQRKHTLYRDNSKLHYYVPYTTTHGFICQGQRKQIPRWTSGRVIQTQSIKRETFLVIELCLHSEHNRISFIYYIFEEYKGLYNWRQLLHMKDVSPQCRGISIYYQRLFHRMLFLNLPTPRTLNIDFN